MASSPTFNHTRVGLDIAKRSLQLDLQGKSCDLPTTASGHAQLVKRLAGLEAAAPLGLARRRA